MKFPYTLHSIVWILFFTSILAFAGRAQCPQIIWADEFEGDALDNTKWSHQFGDGCSIHPDLCGWGNNELQSYTDRNTTVADGKLTITAKREAAGNRNYTSSRIRSINKGDWTYGRFEASIRLPKGQGLWPAFWMLSTDEVYGSWPQSGEIDIMELVGHEPDVVHGTVHYGNLPPANRSIGEDYRLPTGDFSEDFHVFAIEWEENEIRWFVDDYMYAVKTPSDLLPSPWPFDQRFHFLLNVAVGGNWPGDPDGTTLFPQTMEVDYVRVYDGFFPHLNGKRRVQEGSTGEKYTVQNIPENATLTWSVPEGAQIVAGQGTDTVTVDWGVTSGPVAVEISDDCGTQVRRLDVFVESALALAYTLENFDQQGEAVFNSADGDLTEEQNPAPGALNDSPLVGRYVRNSSVQYDVLVYDVSGFENGAFFINNDRRFYIDIYTDAPVGTQILLQLEDKNRNGNDYPTGRHSRFEAFTTKQNQWERLEFQYLDRPDPTTLNTRINQLVLLFNPNSTTGHTYYFDNFDVYREGSVTSTEEVLSSRGPALRIAPNPVRDQLSFWNQSADRLTAWSLVSPTGQRVRSGRAAVEPGSREEVYTGDLAPGMYFLRVVSEKGEMGLHKVLIAPR